MATAARPQTGKTKPPARTASGPADDPLYPHSDGKPLGESEPHMQCIRWLFDAIEDVLQGREEVSIHGDMFWYWREGHPRENRAPDIMVLFGVPMNKTRLSYKSWEHRGIVPAVIIETASAEQESLLLGDIKRDYERAGVKEYFVFDWSEHYLDRQLYGFRRHGRKYRPIHPSEDGSLLSQQLDIQLRSEGRMLRLLDARSGVPVPTRRERLGIQQQLLAEQAAEIERARALLRTAGIDPDAPQRGRP